jgi:hypothetical protein
MLCRVALVRTDVSEELSAFFIKVTRVGELGTTLAVTSYRRTLRRTLFASYPPHRTPGCSNGKHHPSDCWSLPFLVAMQPSGTVGELSVSMEVCFSSLCLAKTAASQNMSKYTKNVLILNTDNCSQISSWDRAISIVTGHGLDNELGFESWYCQKFAYTLYFKSMQIIH